MGDKMPIQRCDSCGEEWWGATVADTVAAGWKSYNIYKGGVFRMCAVCMKHYSPIWQRRKAEEKAAKAGAA